MRFATILACCTLSIVGAAVAQPTEFSNHSAQREQKDTPQDQHPSQDQHTSVRTEQATPPAGHTGAHEQSAHEQSPAPSRARSHTTHVARASHSESCTHQADAHRLRGPRREHFLAGCHPHADPR